MSKMYNPCHPGDVLAEALEGLGVTARGFAKKIDVSPATVTRILNGEGPITATMATKIAKAIPGLSVETWLRLQAKYDAWEAEKKVDVSQIIPYVYQSRSQKSL